MSGKTVSNDLIPAELERRIRDFRVHIVALLFTFFFASANAQAPSTVVVDSSDALQAGFVAPPSTARPRVWWHWLNGNVTEDGIEKDLAWMKRIGIGGLQMFDGALATPQIVDKRLVYMQPDWKKAFHTAVQRADKLDLEFGVASAAGWSETGGPWVRAEDGMKKVVWSETRLVGGRRFKGRLAPPPSVAGPYQNVRATHDPEVNPPANFYRDVVVLAFPDLEPTDELVPTRITINGADIAPTAFAAKLSESGLSVPEKTAAGPGSITLEYLRPMSVASAVLFVANVPLYGGAPAPTLEASDDGHSWSKLATFKLGTVPTTMSFEPIKARFFRLVFANEKMQPHDESLVPAPGADLAAMQQLFIPGLFGGSAKPALVEFRLFAAPQVDEFERKAGFATTNNYHEFDGRAGSDVHGIEPGTVIDLTGRMKPNGELEWTPPRGRWKVLRLGYSLTGRMNHPATPEASGLEVDKYDGAAVERYMTTYLNNFRAVVGDGLIGRHGLRAIVNDSTEVAASNWTPRLLEQFQARRGYDAQPWLPTLTGVIVGSRSQSDAFLYDFRHTLAELAASEHYGTVARVAHQNDLIVYGEALEGERTSLGDDLDMRSFADVPMGALWTYTKRPAPQHVADIRGAASVAHIYGRRAVAAESLTSFLRPWAFAPSDLQPIIDTAFVNGVNLPIIHTSVHQPVDDKQPGLSLLVFGQYFTRHDTWAEMAKPWVEYMARNAYLLQQGRNVADVAYFYGEETPVAAQAHGNYFKDVPQRYAYDFISPAVLLNEISVSNGELISKGGARYKALYLSGTSEWMSLQVLRKIAELAEAGATIIGMAPKSSPNLKDDPVEFAALIRRLWPEGARATGIRGRILASSAIEDALDSAGVTPDFRYAANTPDAEIQFVHRALDDGEIYFLSNRKSRAERIEARFRVSGKAPRIWRADHGTTEPVSFRIEGNETVVPLSMLTNESFFIVFREPAATASREVQQATWETLAEVAGPWDVKFQPGRGAPPATRLPKLLSISEHDDPGIKYFSGESTYTTTFVVPKTWKAGAPLALDLGKIGDVAQVLVNGKDAGIVWKMPFRVNVESLVRRGTNTLEVRVANLWVNRLIGDQQPGAQKIAYTSVKTYTAKAPLRPSGLMGPVVLMRLKSQH